MYLNPIKTVCNKKKNMKKYNKTCKFHPLTKNGYFFFGKGMNIILIVSFSEEILIRNMLI